MFIETLTEKTIEILIMLAIVGSIFYVFVKGLEGMEKNECLKWEQQQQEYQNWYPADWQEKQCQIHGIEL